MSRNCLDVIKSGDRTVLGGKTWNKLFNNDELERVRKGNQFFVDKSVHSCYCKYNFFLNYQMHNMQTEFDI